MLALQRRNKRNTQRARNQSESQILRDIREELRNKRVNLPRIADVQPMKLPRLRKYVFAFVCDVQAINTSSSITNVSNYFALSSVPGYINLLEVFDQYRILQVVVNYYPRTSFDNLSSTSQIYSAIDYEDANLPSGPQELEQYDTCLVACVGEPIQRTFVPRVSIAAYATGIFTSYATVSNQWIDSSSPGVEHYGLKTSVGPTAVPMTYDLKATLFVQMRSQL